VRKLNFLSIPFSIGIVTLSIVPSISLSAKVEFSASAAGSVTSGFHLSNTVTVGVEYTDKKFRPITTEVTTDNKIHPFKYDFNGEADLKVWVIPTLELSLISLIPIKLELDPYIGANAVTGKCSKPFIPYLTFYYGVDYAVGIEKMKFGPISFGPYAFNNVLIAKKNLCPTCGGCISASISTQIAMAPTPITTKEITTSQLCKQTNCSSCLSIPTCGWCSLNNACASGTIEGADDGSCPFNYWNLDECKIYEDPILVLAPTEGTLIAGNTYNIIWTGGSSTGTVNIALLRHDLDYLFFGAGLPTSAISNTGSYAWTVPSGIASTYWQIVVISESNLFNANYSRSFYLDSTYKNDTTIGYYWFITMWSDCSKECNGGIRKRQVFCFNSLGKEVDGINCGPEIYSQEETCNIEDCYDYPINVLSPSYNEKCNLGKINITWTGGKKYGNVYIRFIINGTIEDGYGIPSDSIINTGFYIWDVSKEFPLSDGVQIRIYSESLNSGNYGDTLFGPFKIIEYVNYTINIGVPAKYDLEIQLIGAIDVSPIFDISAGTVVKEVNTLYIGSLIGIGVNDKNSYTTSWQGNQISITYRNAESVVTGDNLFNDKSPVLSGTQIAIITLSAVMLVAAIVGSIIYIRRRRNAKRVHTDRYVPLVEQ